jgi:hypothetical protein
MNLTVSTLLDVLWVIFMFARNEWRVMEVEIELSLFLIRGGRRF